MARFVKLLKTTVVLCLFYEIGFTDSTSSGRDCICQPGKRQFGELVTAVVDDKCPRCYVLEYELHGDQDWAPRVCIKKLNETDPDALFVVIRQSLSVTSFQVPANFPDVSPYLYVCRTLCPLSIHPELTDYPSVQKIHVEISTSSLDALGFELTISNYSDFILKENAPVSLNITPAEPMVLRYNMQEDLSSVKIEAMSEDKSCMILALQALQCPIYDSVERFVPQGYYQTLTSQSGITITKNTFERGQQFVVLLLKATDEECLKEMESNPDVRNRQKEVTLAVIPYVTDGEYGTIIWGTILVYVGIGLFILLMDCCIGPGPRRSDTRNVGAGENIPLGSMQQDQVDSPDYEAIEDKWKNKQTIYVSDVAVAKEEHLIHKSNIFSKNIVTIAIIYAIPVVQLVCINQGVVNITGNQDLCYYNFLCSHQFWIVTDFNHIFSNIGYVLLGLFFILIVYRRKSKDIRCKWWIPKDQLKGIPPHYGFLYAMGWALVMEGILSASYHVCPTKANFQFDTTFMFVIGTLCIVKLYISRHPDLYTYPHNMWLFIAVVVIIGFIDAVWNGVVLWTVYCISHAIVLFVVCGKKYYLGCWKCDFSVFNRMYEGFKSGWRDSFKPLYCGHFTVLFVFVLLHGIGDIIGMIKLYEELSSYLVILFILNILAYLIYYCIMKSCVMKENLVQCICPFLVYAVLAFCFWFCALIFFFNKKSSWKETPAGSREKNAQCKMLNFFDHHDIWHLFSSIGIFFTYMLLLIIDDDLEYTPRTQIKVF